ncbi:ABC transporter ATP-binding protein [Nocardioides donggukensis]|uniref:ATP-binding cassette domain-containing protein n=1 Tax=Nocardioides donggukensis TaxID=2774019 RepID=A0A927K661_9ACTN|nr:ATP-binding cassette domain-containing protein [Nocardioides donggukensis]MBD8869855.1 ATP-binding cassette domain-containing protein [Nocardioides donggukensis]
MIVFDRVSVTYAGAASPVLSEVDLTIPEGEMCLVMGRTGSGKSTLLRAINGLVPHFSGGTLRGTVQVDGRKTSSHRPRDLADVVGFVGQDPLSGFVTDNVEDELAYAMESLGVAPSVMRKRVEETLDLLGLADLRGRPLAQLSGGQQQRVAIGSVLTTHPRVLVLDEPTSALDPLAAEDVLATMQRLVHDLGLTVVLAEHRLERVVQFVDRIVHVPGDGSPVVDGPPATMLAGTPIAPPVVELGRAAGWDPLPLTVRDARRRSVALRAELAVVPPPEHGPRVSGEVLATTRNLVLGYPRRPVLEDVSLTVSAGEVVALMGRNGAGKSTLLRGLVGLHRPQSGTIDSPRAGLVPQVPADLLYAASVRSECEMADRDADAPAGTTRALMDRLTDGIDPDTHPRDLSEGQKLTLALAIVLAQRPALLLLDEPTRGLDYTAKQNLVAILHDLVADGHGVVLATHDVELVAEVATRVVVLADGEVVADGAAREVVVSSPAFAPQVAKIMAPQPWLTARDVASALAASRR